VLVWDPDGVGGELTGEMGSVIFSWLFFFFFYVFFFFCYRPGGRLFPARTDFGQRRRLGLGLDPMGGRVVGFFGFRSRGHRRFRLVVLFRPASGSGKQRRSATSDASALGMDALGEVVSGKLAQGARESFLGGSTSDPGLWVPNVPPQRRQGNFALWWLRPGRRPARDWAGLRFADQLFKQLCGGGRLYKRYSVCVQGYVVCVRAEQMHNP